MYIRYVLISSTVEYTVKRSTLGSQLVIFQIFFSIITLHRFLATINIKLLNFVSLLIVSYFFYKTENTIVRCIFFSRRGHYKKLFLKVASFFSWERHGPLWTDY